MPSLYRSHQIVFQLLRYALLLGLPQKLPFTLAQQATGHTMRFNRLLALLTCILGQITYAGTVQVDPSFQAITKLEEVVPPSQFKLIPIGPLKAGDKITIQVVAANKIYNDITVCIAQEAAAQAYTSNAPCRGQIKAKTPIVLKEDITSDSNYFVVLDNSYAALVKKPVSVTIATRKNLSAEEISKIKNGFQGIQSTMSATFEDSDFNLIVKPCGQSNAFSNNATADITFCSEMIHELALKGNKGALFAILLHEYGHSLLNKWGEPGSSEEDIADQFATAMLLRAGDRGRQLLQEWISYWTAQDSRAEAVAQLQRGDTHTLSIQRARNIQNNINFPEDFVRRWNKMLYRHMTKDALSKIVVKPNKADDLDLAQAALSKK
jgi:Putative metallopeptidase